MGRELVDDDRFPLVFVNCHREFTSESVAEVERGFARVFARRSPYVVVADLTALVHVPHAVVRRQLTEVLNDPAFRAQQERYQVGSANLVHSPLIRAALTAVMWMWNPPWPVSAPESRADAVTWCLVRLRDANVEVPPPLEAFERSLHTSTG